MTESEQRFWLRIWLAVFSAIILFAAIIATSTLITQQQYNGRVSACVHAGGDWTQGNTSKRTPEKCQQ